MNTTMAPNKNPYTNATIAFASVKPIQTTASPTTINNVSTMQKKLLDGVIEKFSQQLLNEIEYNNKNYDPKTPYLTFKTHVKFKNETNPRIFTNNVRIAFLSRISIWNQDNWNKLSDTKKQVFPYFVKKYVEAVDKNDIVAIVILAHEDIEKIEGSKIIQATALNILSTIPDNNPIFQRIDNWK